MFIEPITSNLSKQNSLKANKIYNEMTNKQFSKRNEGNANNLCKYRYNIFLFINFNHS